MGKTYKPTDSPHDVTRDLDLEPDPPVPAPLAFERRQHDRWPADGLAKVFRVAGDRFGEVYTLRIVDESFEGLGATSSWPLEPGTIVSVAFVEPGCPARSGVVLRCRPCGDGYRLAIQYDRALAA